MLQVVPPSDERAVTQFVALMSPVAKTRPEGVTVVPETVRRTGAGQVQHVEPGLASIKTAPDEAMGETGSVTAHARGEDHAGLSGGHAGYGGALAGRQLKVVHRLPGGLGEGGSKRRQQQGCAEEEMIQLFHNDIE